MKVSYTFNVPQSTCFYVTPTSIPTPQMLFQCLCPKFLVCKTKIKRSLPNLLLGDIKVTLTSPRSQTRVSDLHFFADLDPGKNLHADPNLGSFRVVKEKAFFHVSDDSETDDQHIKTYVASFP